MTTSLEATGPSEALLEAERIVLRYGAARRRRRLPVSVVLAEAVRELQRARLEPVATLRRLPD